MTSALPWRPPLGVAVRILLRRTLPSRPPSNSCPATTPSAAMTDCATTAAATYIPGYPHWRPGSTAYCRFCAEHYPDAVCGLLLSSASRTRVARRHHRWVPARTSRVARCSGTGRLRTTVETAKASTRPRRRRERALPPGLRQARCQGCTEYKPIHDDGYCTVCRVWLELEAPRTSGALRARLTGRRCSRLGWGLLGAQPRNLTSRSHRRSQPHCAGCFLPYPRLRNNASTHLRPPSPPTTPFSSPNSMQTSGITELQFDYVAPQCFSTFPITSHGEILPLP